MIIGIFISVYEIESVEINRGNSSTFDFLVDGGDKVGKFNFTMISANEKLPSSVSPLSYWM